jgi:hypothetical protein
MFLSYQKRIFLPLVLIMSITIVQAQDTSNLRSSQTVIDTITDTSTQTNSAKTDDEEFSAFLFVFALAATCFIAGFFFLGVIMCALLALLLVVLISFGIVSTSVYIGWYKKSFNAGFKLFWILGGIVTGLPVGIGGFKMFTYLFKLKLTTFEIVSTGLLLGTLSGGFVGYTAYIILTKSFEFINKRFSLINKDQS